MLVRVLLAIKDDNFREHIKKLLPTGNVHIKEIQKKSDLLKVVPRESFDILIAGHSITQDYVPEIRKILLELPDFPRLIIISDRDSPEEHGELIAAGCDAIIYAGLKPAKLRSAFRAILEKRRTLLKKTLATVRPIAQPHLDDFISKSPTMKSFLETVYRIAPSNTSVLLLGETGVGKERLARAIHAESPRSEGPFIAVNCGALPETLLESELFGHERGAFTGAAQSRRGWFELAHSGTIFLDEIGEMPLHLQVSLLRVLQDKEIQRVGSEKSLKIDVRIMAASNRDLGTEVKAKKFRDDLFYRLSVITLNVPPLRERRDDIPQLVANYMDYLRPLKSEEYDITDEALELLCKYSWPGNVRELMNVLERALLICDNNTITPANLPADMMDGESLQPSLTPSKKISLELDATPDEWLKMPLGDARRGVLDKFEATYLTGLLKQNAGRVEKTAQRAGIQSRSLFDKMKRLGLRKEDFRSRGTSQSAKKTS